MTGKLAVPATGLDMIWRTPERMPKGRLERAARWHPALFSGGTAMRCGFLLALAACLLLPAAGPSMAQTEARPQRSEEAAGFFVVEGVASNDLLNVRATASAGGRVVGRLPNGALLRNLGCSDVNGNSWCEVETVEAPRITGFVAGRYLHETLVDDPGLAPQDEASAAPPIEEGEPPTEAEPARVDAAAEIPCARYYGQPMRMCAASVRRDAEKEATVTVTWPDGGQRVISFRNGRADTSDAPDPVSYTREAELNIIRIGKAERFEIPDALAFGG
jgi:hypothetical protein